MPREISDEEYDYLQARRQVADLTDTVWNDPILGREAKRLLKSKFPNMPIPDYDIETKVDKRVAEVEQRLKDEKAEDQRIKQEAAWKRQRADTMTKYNLTEEGMADIEKKMLEKNVGDYDIAAQHWAPKPPSASDPAFKDPYYNFAKGETFKEIAADPEAWGRSEIMKALNTTPQNRQF